MIKPIAKILIRFELPKLLWTPAAGAIGSRFIEVMSSRIKPLLEMRLKALLSTSFLMSLMSVNRSQRVTSQFLRSP
jgi:hypothetical protein